MPTLYVTLDTSKNPPALDINEGNGLNAIPQSSVAQIITWKLNGNAASGTFNALTNPTAPGFAWTGTQPSHGIFLNPQLSGNQFSLSDLNSSPATAGTWTYQLWATINGQAYSTIATGTDGKTTNPTVNNR